MAGERKTLMFNVRTICNWAIFSLVCVFIISLLSLFDTDKAVALILICYGHSFLSQMWEREYAHRRLKKYQKAVSELTELVRSTEYPYTISSNNECEK